jgi:DNA-binding response OmpR family regulator
MGVGRAGHVRLRAFFGVSPHASSLTVEQEHQVIEAADGAEALVLLFQERPDVLILDVAMPILNGLAVCRAARAERKLDQVGIILISANASAVEALAAGADRFMPKPFRPLELRWAIDEVVAQRQNTIPDRRSTTSPRLVDAS